jgi:hypothetical protein
MANGLKRGLLIKTRWMDGRPCWSPSRSWPSVSWALNESVSNGTVSVAGTKVVCAICSPLATRRPAVSQGMNPSWFQCESDHSTPLLLSSGSPRPLPEHHPSSPISHLDVPHQTGTNPRIPVLPLIPVHEAPPPRDPRMRRPRPAQHDVVQAVEEVGRVARVHGHRAEALPRLQRRRGPLPRAAEVRLAREAVALVGDGRRVPGPEGGGCGGEVDKRGRFLNTVVDQVSGADVSDRSIDWGRGERGLTR